MEQLIRMLIVASPMIVVAIGLVGYTYQLSKRQKQERELRTKQQEIERYLDLP